MDAFWVMRVTGACVFAYYLHDCGTGLAVPYTNYRGAHRIGSCATQYSKRFLGTLLQNIRGNGGQFLQPLLFLLCAQRGVVDDVGHTTTHLRA